MCNGEELSDFEKAVLIIVYAKPNLTENYVDWLAREQGGYTHKLKNSEAGKAFLTWAEKIGSLEEVILQVGSFRILWATKCRQLFTEPPEDYDPPHLKLVKSRDNPDGQ